MALCFNLQFKVIFNNPFIPLYVSDFKEHHCWISDWKINRKDDIRGVKQRRDID